MKEYLYETHMHTFPVSKCAKNSVREMLEFYKKQNYSGVFVTNHFIDGNINCDKSLPYAEKIEFYFSDYEDALRIGAEIGIPVFLGVEISLCGTDFLIYGLDKEWFLEHPELDTMGMSEKLTLMKDAGALIIQAHPFREAGYINHIRLFPRHIHGVEIYNAHRLDFENNMAKHYAESYGLLPFAGSDKHNANVEASLGGMKSTSPIVDESDFVKRVKNGDMQLFRLDFEIETE